MSIRLGGFDVGSQGILYFRERRTPAPFLILVVTTIQVFLHIDWLVFVNKLFDEILNDLRLFQHRNMPALIQKAYFSIGDKVVKM